MAHEQPIRIPNRDTKDNTSEATRDSKTKMKSGKDKERRLPNGMKVDFGGKNSKNKKGEDKKSEGRATLPNGEKPNFFNDKKKKGEQQLRGQLLPNGEKPNFSSADEKPNPSGSKKMARSASSSKEKKSAVEDVTYAGSSFHSSPAALALPKPSFKTSPKQATNSTVDFEAVSSPQSSVASTTSGSSYSPTTGNIQKARSPQFSVTAYPPGSVQTGAPPFHQAPYNQYIQPGFAYNYSPQGYIQYQIPGAHPPHPGHPVHPQTQAQYPYPNQYFSHYQQGNPMPMPGHPGPVTQPSVGGHKITFNDLLGSTKN